VSPVSPLRGLHLVDAPILCHALPALPPAAPAFLPVLWFDRCQIKRAKDTIDRLQLEMEDLEAELDDNGVALNQEQELVRRIQLDRSDNRAASNWNRAVRLERCRDLVF